MMFKSIAAKHSGPLPPEADRAYPLPVVAERLGCGMTTVREEIRDGNLTAIKIRRRVAVPAVSLAAYIAERMKAAKLAAA